MKQQARLADVTVRRARASDREAMLDMTKDVWGGNDYLPFAWNSWLHDHDGILMAAVRGGEVVGLQHAVTMPDGSTWLEGIRVAPEVQGRGIGRALLDAGIAWARSMDSPAVRLSTSNQNEASNRMAEHAGLREVAFFRTAEALPGADALAAGVRVAIPAEADAIAGFLQRVGSEFYSEGWTAYRLTPQRVALLLAMGSIATVGGEVVDGVAIASYNGRRPILRLGLLAGSKAATEHLAGWVRGRAGATSLEHVRAQVEPGDDVIEALDRAGYRTDFEHLMVLRELRLA